MAEMTIKEAAEALGVSVDTVRRRIKDNKVKAWKIEGTYGPQWVIDSDSLAEYQQVVDVVPVKYNMDPSKLIDSIRQTVEEAAAQGAKKGILEAMQENKQDYTELQEQIILLQEQNKSLIKLIEDKQGKSMLDKLRVFFKSDK